MKLLTTLIALIICMHSYSQEFFLEVEYSTGVTDSIIFGYGEDATIGIDPLYNEINIYGSPLQNFDLRSIQRVLDSDSDCQYQSDYDENIDTKVNIRRYEQNNSNTRIFEFILTSQDTNFNIRLKGSNFVDSFISFESDTCSTPGFPPRFRIEQNLIDLDLKPLMRYSGLSAVNHIVFIIEEIDINSNTKEKLESNISVLPNPASQYVSISNEENSIQEITILDFNGQIILKEKDLNKKKIDLKLNQFSKGLYLIRVKLQDNKLLTKKLFIN